MILQSPCGVTPLEVKRAKLKTRLRIVWRKLGRPHERLESCILIGRP